MKSERIHELLILFSPKKSPSGFGEAGEVSAAMKEMKESGTTSNEPPAVEQDEVEARQSFPIEQHQMQSWRKLIPILRVCC
jgi:Sec-independent protein translocase protein TatA